MTDGHIILCLCIVLLVLVLVFMHTNNQHDKEMENMQNHVDSVMKDYDKRLSLIENTKSPMTEQIRQEMKNQFQIEASKNQYLASHQTTGKHVKKEEEK